MPKYRLTKAAENDLIAIAQFGDMRFGVTQSNKYRDRLKKRFSAIAKNPFLYPSVDYIKPEYRRSICGAHSVYYKIEPDEIVIIRIIYNQDTSFLDIEK